MLHRSPADVGITQKCWQAANEPIITVYEHTGTSIVLVVAVVMVVSVMSAVINSVKVTRLVA